MKRILIASLLTFPTPTFNMEQAPLPVRSNRTFTVLPHDVERIIQMMTLEDIPQMELKDTLKNLANFSRINKSFHAFVNNPKNTKLLLKAMARIVLEHNELSLAKGLKKMPGIQSTEVRLWLALRKELLALEHELIYCKNIGKLDNLLALGIDINTRGKDGVTPLIHALNVYTEITYIQQLLLRGASVHICDKCGSHALLKAARNYEQTQEILKYNPPINKANVFGTTPLMSASENPQSLEALLKAGADVAMQDEDGKTALMLAADNARFNSIKVLLRYGANLDMQDKKGRTALMQTLRNAHHPESCVPAVLALLEGGANPFIRNNAGQTPLDFLRAYRLSSPLVHRLLEEAEKRAHTKGSTQGNKS